MFLKRNNFTKQLQSWVQNTREYDYVVVVAIALPLSVYISNSTRIDIINAWRPFVVWLMVGVMMWLVLFFCIGNRSRAGLATVAALIGSIFFTDFIVNLHEVVVWFGAVTFFVHETIAWFFLIGVAWLWCISASDNIIQTVQFGVRRFVFVFMLTLTGVLGVQLIRGEAITSPIIDQFKLPVFVSEDVTGQVLPDIVYIILDGHGRRDVLQSEYGVSSNVLYDFFDTKNFYIASRSLSNYPKTLYSIPSSLNSVYFEQTNELESRYIANLQFLIKQSATRDFLEQLGYRTYSLTTGFESTEIRDADTYIHLPGGMSEFGMLLFSKSPLSIVPFPGLHKWLFYNHSKRIVTAFEAVPTMVSQPGKKFVFVHIMAPHPPFVFSANGHLKQQVQSYSIVDGTDYLMVPGHQHETYVKGYAEQVTYIDRLLSDVLLETIAQARRPLIIVVQGDHGPGLYYNQKNTSVDQPKKIQQRFAILNAYYFWDGQYNKLYPHITPVNTFRVIFNTYFDQHLPLLDDVSYYLQYPISGEQTPEFQQYIPE